VEQLEVWLPLDATRPDAKSDTRYIRPDFRVHCGSGYGKSQIGNFNMEHWQIQLIALQKQIAPIENRSEGSRRAYERSFEFSA
jgi:hypothetical protein